jgi:hypothetical protein
MIGCSDEDRWIGWAGRTGGGVAAPPRAAGVAAVEFELEAGGVEVGRPVEDIAARNSRLPRSGAVADAAVDAAVEAEDAVAVDVVGRAVVERWTVAAVRGCCASGCGVGLAGVPATGSAVTGVCACGELLVLGVGRTGVAGVELLPRVGWAGLLGVVPAGVGDAARCTTGGTGVLPGVRGPLSVGPFDPCDGATGSAVTGVCAALLELPELVLGVGRTGAAAVELVVLDVVLAGDVGGVGEAARCTTG